MSCEVIKMTGNHVTGIREMARILKEELQEELISESWRNLNGASAVLLSFERYFFRNGSYASLTVMLTETADVQTADIIGSGGGEGLFNISWGANSDFADMAADLLQAHGFQREA